MVGGGCRDSQFLVADLVAVLVANCHETGHTRKYEGVLIPAFLLCPGVFEGGGVIP